MHSAGRTYDFAIIGGGIAGASVAAELAAHGRVIVLETEQQPGYHSTGRSAAIFAQTYGNAVIRALTRASTDMFDAPPEGFSDAPLLSPRGLMRIARADQIDTLRALYDEVTDTGFIRWLEADEVQAEVPLLRDGYAAGGFLNAAAQDIDVHALLNGYLRCARAAGGEIATGAAVDALKRVSGGWQVHAGDAVYHCGTVINAAGAWADEVAGMAGVAGAGLVPMRRSAITFAGPAGADLTGLRMIVDAEEQFYLKPEAGKLMASPADETPSPPCDSRPEELDIAICVDRIMGAFKVEVRRIESSWAGLRTFSADRAPLCGFDPEVPGFFWLAGQGGFGVQTAPALARLASALVRGVAPDQGLVDAGVRVEHLAPGRMSLAA